MDQARSVSASFELQQRTLTLTKNGNGAGSVTSTPAGIDCGPTCSSGFDYGTEVTLTAAAAEGSTFTGWSGACSGTGSCVVTMDQARSVSASFELQQRALTLTKNGNGAGSVTSTPAGIDCGPTCSSDFDYGTEVTLTAAAPEGSTFTGWSGACSGTGSCVVTMDQARSVSASFELQQGPPVVAKISKVKVKGPAKVKRGRKATYKVKITNSGNKTATGVRLKVKGRGVSFNTSVGTVAAGKTRTVKIRLKARKPGKVKVSFKVTSKNAGGRTVKKKITVKK
jgi:Fe-S cluster biogenesis protein NfuA